MTGQQAAPRRSTEEIETLIAPYRTEYDEIRSAYREEQYQKGRQMAREGAHVHIARNSVWSATYPDTISSTGCRMTRSVFSYETLGLHANTADLLRGWLEGGAPITDHRPGVPLLGTPPETKGNKA